MAQATGASLVPWSEMDSLLPAGVILEVPSLAQVALMACPLNTGLVG